MQLNLFPSNDLQCHLVQNCFIQKHLRSYSETSCIIWHRETFHLVGCEGPWKWTALVIVNIPLTSPVYVPVSMNVLCECDTHGSKCSILRLLHLFAILCKWIAGDRALDNFFFSPSVSYVIRNVYIFFLSQNVYYENLNMENNGMI